MNDQPKTTRDQLEKLFDVLRRATRYWWLVILIVIVGAGLSVAIALQQKHTYESETVLLYQEKISKSVLQGKEVVESSRKLAERYREMLLARSNLSQVIDEFKLFPDVVEEEGTVAAAEILRTRLTFRDRGAGTFRISYRGDTPKEAQQIAGRLAELLREQDARIRREQAEMTKDFLEEERRRAELTLKGSETELAMFLAQHPEFVEDGSGDSVGASIRAANEAKANKPSGNSKLLALERARRRIKARLDNPEAVLMPRVATSKETSNDSPALKQARREVEQAERDLQDKLEGGFTAKHPDVISAQNSVAAAKRRLRRVEAEELAVASPASPPPIRTEVDRKALEAELGRIERAIAGARDSSPGDEGAGDSTLADKLVSLETEFTRLSRRVDQDRERLQTLEGRVFTAEITASSEFAEAAQLVTIDEAFLPAHPAGQGRKLIALAGTMVFAALGFGLAIGLALIDDRIYRRQDVDELGIAPVLVVVPRQNQRKSRRRG